jgi:hypothetical protein
MIKLRRKTEGFSGQESEADLNIQSFD